MSDGGDWEGVIRSMLEHACQLIQQMLERFRDKLDKWLTDLLGGPIPENWREELARFAEETRADGLVIKPDGIAALEGIIQARVEANARQQEAVSARSSPSSASPLNYGPEVPSYLVKPHPAHSINDYSFPWQDDGRFLRTSEQRQWQEANAILKRQLLEQQARGHHGRRAQQELEGVDLDVVAPLPKHHLNDFLLEPLTGQTHEDLVLAAVKSVSDFGGQEIKLSNEEILNHPGRWIFDVGVDMGTDPLTYVTLGDAALARIPAAFRAIRAARAVERVGKLEKTAVAAERVLLVRAEGAAERSFVIDVGGNPHAGSEVFAGRGILATGEQYRVPSKFVGNLSDTQVTQRFDTLLQYRQQLPNFSPQVTGNRTADGVTALLEIDGRQYFGHNGWAARSGATKSDILNRQSAAGFRPNGNTPFHAEGHVFDQALQAGERGGLARLHVDATFCGSCGSPFNGVENMSRALEFERVEVFIRLPNGHIVSGVLY